ncbi:MAG: PadR family transcriptional regulator [bacterium]
MTIDFAILAMLTGGPRSGYDLKKLFTESESLHWSGNNNQVYGALVGLHSAGLADREVLQPFEGPGKKLYTITDKGRTALRDWLAGEAELPHMKFPILAMLAAGDLLSAEELDDLFARYAHGLRLKVLGLEELERRGSGPSFGSPRQRILWQAINARALALHRSEEEWVRNVRWAAARAATEETPA